MKINLESIIGKSDTERAIDDIARIKMTNPRLAEKLEKKLRNPEKFTVTDAMREGAKENEAFHSYRSQE